MAARRCFEKNCKGRVVDKFKGVYCEHIESSLPKPSRQSIKAITGYRGLENEPKEEQEPQKDMEKGLRDFGLSEYEVDLVMARAVEGRNMVDIVDLQKWTSLGSANYHLRKTLKKLRKGGFGLE